MTFCLFTLVGFTQPPPPGNGHGQNSNQSGGGAPVGSGLFILLGLGAVYGGKKIYSRHKKEGK